MYNWQYIVKLIRNIIENNIDTKKKGFSFSTTSFNVYSQGKDFWEFDDDEEYEDEKKEDERPESMSIN